MLNSTIKTVIRDAESAMRSGYRPLAHRLLCRADRLASADPAIPAERCDRIRAARMLVAATL